MKTEAVVVVVISNTQKMKVFFIYIERKILFYICIFFSSLGRIRVISVDVDV